MSEGRRAREGERSGGTEKGGREGERERTIDGGKEGH